MSEQKRILWWCIVLFIFSAIRYGIGYDYFSYYYSISMADWHIYTWEPIPQLMSVFASRTNTYFFFFLCWGLERCPIKYSWMSLLMIVSFPLFYMYYLNAVRQGMALSVIFCAIAGFWGKPKKQLLLIIIACLCHLSSVAAVILLVPFHKIKTKYLLYGFLLSFFIGEIAVGYVGSFVSNIPYLSRFEEYSVDKHNINASDGRLIGYLLYLINLICLKYRDKIVRNETIEEYFKYLVALVCIGASFNALFSTVDATMAKRFSTMFFVAITLVIPIIWDRLKYSKSLYTLGMIVLFCITIFLQSGTRREEDKGTSPTYPYRTMIFKFNEGRN